MIKQTCTYHMHAMLQIPYYKLSYGLIHIVQQKVNMWFFCFISLFAFYACTNFQELSFNKKLVFLVL